MWLVLGCIGADFHVFMFLHFLRSTKSSSKIFEIWLNFPDVGESCRICRGEVLKYTVPSDSTDRQPVRAGLTTMLRPPQWASAADPPWPHALFWIFRRLRTKSTKIRKKSENMGPNPTEPNLNTNLRFVWSNWNPNKICVVHLESKSNLCGPPGILY